MMTTHVLLVGLAASQHGQRILAQIVRQATDRAWMRTTWRQRSPKRHVCMAEVALGCDLRRGMADGIDLRAGNHTARLPFERPMDDGARVGR
jgi:hypothetical protein